MSPNRENYCLQPVLVFFYKIEYITKVFRILNLEGQQNRMIGPKVKAILMMFLSVID